MSLEHIQVMHTQGLHFLQQPKLVLHEQTLGSISDVASCLSAAARCDKQCKLLVLGTGELVAPGTEWEG